VGLRLKTLRCLNWCQHRELVVDLDADTVGIIGAVGSGKSNLLEAVYFGVTHMTRDVMEENISWGEDEATVELTADLDGEQLFVQHTIERGGSSALEAKVPGTRRKITKVSTYKSKLEAALGFPLGMMDGSIFVHQNAMKAVIFDTQSESSKYLDRLFRLDEFEKQRKHVFALASKVLQPKIDEISVRDADSIQARIDEVSVFISDKKEELKAAKESLDSAGDLDQANEDMASHRSRQRHLEELDRMKASVKASFDPDQLAKLEADRKKTNSWLVENKGKYDTARKIDEWKTKVDEANELVAEVEETLEEVDGELKKLDLKSLQEEVESLEARVAELVEGMTWPLILHTAVQDGESVCPTCTQELSDKLIKSVQAEVEAADECEKLEDSLRQKAKALKEVSSKSAKLEGTKESLESRLDTARSKLSKLKPGRASEEKVQKAREFKGRYEERREKLGTVEEEIEKFAAEKERIDKISAKQKIIDEIPAVDAKKAQATISEHQRLNATISRIEGGLESAEKELERLQSDLVQSSPMEEKRTRLIELRKYFEGLYDLLHRERLPKALRTCRLASIQATINAYLGMFNSGFLVDVNRLTAQKDAHRFPMSRLSGGQSIMTSLAFRFALVERVMPNVGVAAFDEPTTWLGRNKEVLALRDLLSDATLRERLVASGVQLLVSTHDEKLVPVFDQLIRVEG